jgi:hypothetical protein
MDMNETTAKTPLVDEATRELEATFIEDPLLRLVVRQQELIVMQSEQLAKAIGAILAENKAPLSLRAELDELFGAIAKITPADLARAAEVARMLFDTLKHSCAVGGGAVRGTS